MLVVLLLVAAVAVAEEPPTPAAPATTVPPSPPAEQQTTVRGTVPDLAGRWLVVGAIKLPTGKERTVPAVWEVARRDGQPVLTIRFVDLPAAQRQALDQANAAETAWRPSSADLAAVAAAWDGLTVQDPKIATLTTELIGSDAFDDAMKSEAISKDALFIVRQLQNFLPTAAPTLKQVNVYAINGTSPTGYTGNFTLAVVAAAPFPIPITLNGMAELYRLQSAPQGFLARVLDVFRGCGR
jgi:hypothetical protein